MFVYDIHDHKLRNAARWQEPTFHKASDHTMIHIFIDSFKWIRHLVRQVVNIIYIYIFCLRTCSTTKPWGSAFIHVEYTWLAEITTELVCPLGTPCFLPGTDSYDPKRHDLIEGVSKCMISIQGAQAMFNEYRESQGSHDEVYTDGPKVNERVAAAAVINRHF